MRKAFIILILACVSSILVNVFALHNSAAIDPAAVAGMWLFDEGEGDTAKDSSGNGNDGTLFGPEWVDDGKIGVALRFDGVDDYVDCGNDASLNLTSQLTLVAWNSHPPGTEGYIIIKNTQDDATRQWGFLDYVSTGNMSFFCNTGAGREQLDWSGNIDDDTWHHFALTIDNQKVELFIDGVSAGIRNLASQIGASDATVWIGRRKPSNFPYTGLLDEVAVFSVVLSSDDVNRVMDEGLAKVAFAVSPEGKLPVAWAMVKGQY